MNALEPSSLVYLPSNPSEQANEGLLSFPSDVIDVIFDYLPCAGLKTFLQYKVEDLGQALTGEEDSHRLMLGQSFIFYKKIFMDVTKQVYNLACCNKAFCVLTYQKRYILKEAANWAKIDKDYFIDEPSIRTPNRIPKKHKLDPLKLISLQKFLQPQFLQPPRDNMRIQKWLPPPNIERELLRTLINNPVSFTLASQEREPLRDLLRGRIEEFMQPPNISELAVYFKPCSFTSRCMSQLKSWRDSEATTLGEQIVHSGKVVITELALPLLNLAASVEESACKAFGWNF